MKLTQQNLKELINEEVAALRESPRGEDPDDWRDQRIEEAIQEGEADASAGRDHAGGYGAFQRHYDTAYDRVAKKAIKEKVSPYQQLKDIIGETLASEGFWNLFEGVIPVATAQALAADAGVKLSYGYAAILGKQFENTPDGRASLLRALKSGSYKQMLQEKGKN